MKLTWHMPHRNTFHIPKNEGSDERVSRESIQKTIKKSCEMNEVSNLTSPNNSLRNAKEVGIFLMKPLLIWLYCWLNRGGAEGCFL